MKIEVIGIDHISISVSQLARSEKYYDQIMPLLGFKKNSFPNEGELHIQYWDERLT
jgi:glyoxylase I family protein